MSDVMAAGPDEAAAPPLEPRPPAGQEAPATVAEAAQAPAATPEARPSGPFYEVAGRLVIHGGDCREALAAMPESSVDAVVCDPPYGLSAEPDIGEVMRHWLAGTPYTHRGGGFMGKSWDSFVPGPDYWRHVLRVLKPGGHALVFAGTRTVDLMTVALRFAGFDIRDSVFWVYGSGFPKSLDVAKAIDKAKGHDTGPDQVSEAESGVYGDGVNNRRCGKCGKLAGGGEGNCGCPKAGPVSDEAKRWQGWGTALKPAHEPVIVARKPLGEGTVALNVLAHGTGALHIDACRVPGDNPSIARREEARRTGKAPGHPGEYGDLIVNRVTPERYMQERPGEAIGRWPANVMHDGSAEAEAAFAAAGELKPRGNAGPSTSSSGTGFAGGHNASGAEYNHDLPGAAGATAARFFYCAKASKSERDAGLAGREAGGGVRSNAPRASEEVKTRARLNTHPTVKPLELMKWLCRLATPPGGVVLDPFLGSGSTALAALAEGFRFVGVEKEEEYLQIARARIEAALLAEREGPPKKAKGAPRARKPKAEAATAEAPQDAPEATP